MSIKYYSPDYGYSSSEVERWVESFRSFGFPVASFYMNKIRTGFRCKVRLVYPEKPDMEAVRQDIEDFWGVSRLYGRQSFEVIDQGVRWRSYVVDVVWYLE